MLCAKAQERKEILTREIQIAFGGGWGRMRDVASYLAIGRRAALDLCHRQGLPYVKCAGRTSPLRVRASALAAWIIDNESTTKTGPRWHASPRGTSDEDPTL